MLHQPAAFYGINSMTLGSRVEKKSGFEPIDNADLADKERLLAYFARAVTAFEATGRVRYFANATFDSEHKAIDTAGGGRSTVSFRKLVVPTSNVQVLPCRVTEGAGIHHRLHCRFTTITGASHAAAVLSGRTRC